MVYGKRWIIGSHKDNGHSLYGNNFFSSTSFLFLATSIEAPSLITRYPPSPLTYFSISLRLTRDERCTRIKECCSKLSSISFKERVTKSFLPFFNLIVV